MDYREQHSKIMELISSGGVFVQEGILFSLDWHLPVHKLIVGLGETIVYWGYIGIMENKMETTGII